MIWLESFSAQLQGSELRAPSGRRLYGGREVAQHKILEMPERPKVPFVGVPCGKDLNTYPGPFYRRCPKPRLWPFVLDTSSSNLLEPQAANREAGH